MVFTLGAVPHVLFVEDLTLLELAQTVCELDVRCRGLRIHGLIVIFFLFKWHCSGEVFKQFLFDFVVPGDLNLQFLASAQPVVAKQTHILLNLEFF